jgi:hypothetical protein
VTFSRSPGVYVHIEPEPSEVMNTFEDIEKALNKVAEYSLFTPNNEANLHYIKATFAAQLHEIYFNGFKICDRDGDPIENVEDCEVVVTMSDDYTLLASFVPTVDYWNRKLEIYARDFEGLIASLQADAAMEFFDPCI